MGDRNVCTHRARKFVSPCEEHKWGKLVEKIEHQKLNRHHKLRILAPNPGRRFFESDRRKMVMPKLERFIPTPITLSVIQA